MQIRGGGLKSQKSARGPKTPRNSDTTPNINISDFMQDEDFNQPNRLSVNDVRIQNLNSIQEQSQEYSNSSRRILSEACESNILPQKIEYSPNSSPKSSRNSSRRRSSHRRRSQKAGRNSEAFTDFIPPDKFDNDL